MTKTTAPGTKTAAKSAAPAKTASRKVASAKSASRSASESPQAAAVSAEADVKPRISATARPPAKKTSSTQNDMPAATTKVDTKLASAWKSKAGRDLSEAERTELASLYAELDAEEALALAPALARIALETEDLRAERARVEAWARELERVVEQQENLLVEARAYAGRLRVRRAALADEARRLKAS